MGRAKKRRKAIQKGKRIKRLKAGKLVRFCLANSPKKYPGITDRYNYQSNMRNLIYKGGHFENVRYMNCIITSCNFKEAKLYGVDFMHTNLKGTKFNNSVIKNCIFFNCKLRNTDFTNAVFENVFFICTNINSAKGLIADEGWKLEKSYPQLDLSDSLKKSLREIANYRQLFNPHVLHVNADKPNLWIVKILLDRYNESLPRALIALGRRKDKRKFYTMYSYKKFIDDYLKL